MVLSCSPVRALQLINGLWCYLGGFLWLILEVKTGTKKRLVRIDNFERKSTKCTKGQEKVYDLSQIMDPIGYYLECSDHVWIN